LLILRRFLLLYSVAPAALRAFAGAEKACSCRFIQVN